MEQTLGIKCPFCNDALKSETYRMRKGYPPTMTIFCDNDQCGVKPSTIDTNPSAAFADVEAWGRLPKGSDSTEIPNEVGAER